MENQDALKTKAVGAISYIAEDMASLPVCPDYVEGDFILVGNSSLVDLQGTPSEVTGVFHIACCDSLSSWEGSNLKNCGELDTMLSSIRTCTGGPDTVGDRILVAPDTDLYDLPGGTWHTLIFGDGYSTHVRSDVTSVLATMKVASPEELAATCARTGDPLSVWVASRMLRGLPPFSRH